jgi:hypothetical protein
MARKEIKYTVDDEGRDKGKLFVITEMWPRQSEAWGMKALLALIKNGVDLPEGFESRGMAGMAELGLRGLVGLKYEDAEPLLAEMMGCVSIIPDPKNTKIVRNLIDEDIEEIMTRVKLRAEVWNLHTGFLVAAVRSKVSEPKGQAASEQEITPSTQT